MLIDQPWSDSLSKNQRLKQAKIIARKMMVRNQSFSLLVSQHYQNHIRLSIHGHPNHGPKFG
jgi:pyoverdine/dityrosine biosynthesis protein Dit1